MGVGGSSPLISTKKIPYRDDTEFFVVSTLYNFFYILYYCIRILRSLWAYARQFSLYGDMSTYPPLRSGLYWRTNCRDTVGGRCVTPLRSVNAPSPHWRSDYLYQKNSLSSRYEIFLVLTLCNFDPLQLYQENSLSSRYGIFYCFDQLFFSIYL